MARQAYLEQQRALNTVREQVLNTEEQQARLKNQKMAALRLIQQIQEETEQMNKLHQQLIQERNQLERSVQQIRTEQHEPLKGNVYLLVVSNAINN
jgi:chromosome segregation ATPase